MRNIRISLRGMVRVSVTVMVLVRFRVSLI